MKIIIAPNALKGSLTAAEAAAAMAKGIARISTSIDVVQVPVADGGDGTLAVLASMLPMERHYGTVSGPNGELITAAYLFEPKQKLAVIEMAQVAGLALLGGQKNAALKATTEGFGQLLGMALDQGARRIILGVGGSATTDAGVGLLSALGARFFDKKGRLLLGEGLSLGLIDSVDLRELDKRLASCEIQVLCDVTNPVLGKQGAVRIFAPQKGATADEVEILDAGMENFIQLLEYKLGMTISTVAGGGAGGGIGASLFATLGAELLPGADTILGMLKFDELICDADLVITAEGQLDSQTCAGKVPAIVASRADKQEIPCIVIAGSIPSQQVDELPSGFTAAFSLCSCPMDLSVAMTNASSLLTHAAEQVVRCFAANGSTIYHESKY